jgi:hypothetical protein
MGSSLNFNVSPTAASQYMVPAGGSGAGMVDVVNDFSWTLNKSSTLRRDVPYIELTEYQQTNGAVVANILYYYRVIGNAIPNINSLAGQNQDPTDVFKMKYIADPTGFVYKLPYFAQQRIARYNTFSDQDNQNPFGRVGESIFNNFSKGSNLFQFLPAFADVIIGTPSACSGVNTFCK